MAHTVTNRGLYYLLNTAISGSTDFRTAAFKGGPPTAATIRDWNFLSDVTGSYTEAAATNYARQDLASVTITESDASDNVTITATAPTISSVGAGETWTFVAHYVEGASDAARTLISIDAPASPLVTNGGHVTLPQFSITVTGS